MAARQDKKTEILDAAFAVLRDAGVQGLSFDTVARAAGQSRQLVRYYFESQDALMTALCDHLAALYRDALVNGVTRTNDANRLEFFLDFYFDLVDDLPKPRDDQVYDAVFAWAAGSPAVRESLNLQYGLLGQVVSHEIQLQHPRLAAEECLELSYLFVCLMYGHWKMVATLGFCEDHRFITRGAMDRLLASYVDSSPDRRTPLRAWTRAT